MPHIKQKLQTAKKFVYDNYETIGYVVYIAGCATVGALIGKSIAENINANSQMRIDYDRLFRGVAAGHDFKWEPTTGELWDTTVRPDKAV